MNVMTFIQHSADREGHRERLAEKQGVHSTVLQGGSSEEEFTSTASSSRKEPPPLRRCDLPHFHFQQFCIQLIQQSGLADVDGSTPAHAPNSTTEKVPGPDVTRVCPSSSGGRTAEVTLIQPWQVDARSSTTKILGPGPNTSYALALLMM